MLKVARALLLFAILFAWQPSADAQERVRIGILAYLGAEHSVEDWSPSLGAVRTILGNGATVEALPLDHAGLAQALAQRSVDFIITNPGHYVELELAYGISRILTRQSKDPVASTFVVRKDSPIRTLADLRHRTLAAVGKEAFGGFQVGWRDMLESGVDAESDITLKPVGLPMTRVVDAVVAGEADAGIIRACILERQIAAGAIAADSLKVIGQRGLASGCAVSSRSYPDWPIAKARDTSAELAKKVATTLLAWQPSDEEAGWTVPLDYQPVHDLFRELKIGPYAHLRHETLAGFLWRMRHWLVLTGVVLLGWLVHVARVEMLVRRRTAELEAAHQALVHEMAARRAAEDRDALHLRELDHAGRLSMVGEMASGLAHELNQPLAAIVNYANGCTIRLRSGQIDPDGLLVATQRIQQQADRAAQIIQQMRAFVRKREADMRPCDVNAIVQEALVLFEGMVRRAGAAVTVSLADGLPMVSADKIRIQQVLLNLFQNGLDAMNGSESERRLKVTTRLHDGSVEVAVADRGPGLSEAARQRLFEPFFTTKQEGLGLGLSLCKSIAEAHLGSLTAATSTTGGAMMILRLPTMEPAV